MQAESEAISRFDFEDMMIMNLLSDIQTKIRPIGDHEECRSEFDCLVSKILEVKEQRGDLNVQARALSGWVLESRIQFDINDSQSRIDSIDSDLNERLKPLDNLIQVKKQYVQLAEIVDKALIQLSLHAGHQTSELPTDDLMNRAQEIQLLPESGSRDSADAK